MAPRMSQLIGTTRPRFGIGKPALSSKTPVSPGSRGGRSSIAVPIPDETNGRGGVGGGVVSRARGGAATPSTRIPGTKYGGVRVKNPDPPGFKDPGDQKRLPGTKGSVGRR